MLKSFFIHNDLPELYVIANLSNLLKLLDVSHELIDR